MPLAGLDEIADIRGLRGVSPSAEWDLSTLYYPFIQYPLEGTQKTAEEVDFCILIINPSA